MQQSAGYNRELRATFAARVHWSFVRAKVCVRCARAALKRGDTREFKQWMKAARLLRMGAAQWRERARQIAPVLVCLLSWCLVGCTKAPREFNVAFNVQPSPDGRSVAWSLKFTRADFNAMVLSTADQNGRSGINSAVHAKVRDLIAAGLESHELTGCPAIERAVATLEDDGIAFLGSCYVGTHTVPAGGI